MSVLLVLAMMNDVQVWVSDGRVYIVTLRVLSPHATRDITQTGRIVNLGKRTGSPELRNMKYISGSYSQAGFQ